MAITIDLIIVALILLSTYLGYRKGLIGVAFKIVSFIIAIIITLILFKPVSNLLIEHTQIDESIERFYSREICRFTYDRTRRDANKRK